ncbi:MAG: thiamine-phosphate kinase, partial [Cyclobacteriaceae bacterium]
SSSVLGIGDDAAAIDTGEKYQLISTDLLTEGIHFDLSYTPLQHLGYKAVAVNVSDIAAMNGIPQQITVSIALSNRFSVEAIDVLYQGIQLACENFGVDLIGGDTTASRSGLVISVTAIGEVEKDKMAVRSGARNKDIVCVSGDLGAAYMGLQVMEREKVTLQADPQMKPQLDKYDYVVRRLLKPEARTDIVYELRDLGIIPTSMIDISDGLASEIFHICEQSKLGMNIYEENLPIDELTYQTAAEFKIDPNTCALNGGEDYELLFTIRQEDFEKIKNHRDIHVIGYMHETAKGINFISRKQQAIPLQAQGWSHFKPGNGR